MYSQRLLRAGAPDCPVCTGQCPVRQISAAQTSRSRVFLRRLRLKFTGLSGVHRTVRCAIEQTASQRPLLVVGAINTPQPPLFKGSKHSLHVIQYKSNTQHSKTQIKASDRIKVPNSTLVFKTCEEIDLCSFVALVAWLAFFFLSFLPSKPCKQSKRHQLCGGPCGV